MSPFANSSLIFCIEAAGEYMIQHIEKSTESMYDRSASSRGGEGIRRILGCVDATFDLGDWLLGAFARSLFRCARWRRALTRWVSSRACLGRRMSLTKRSTDASAQVVLAQPYMCVARDQSRALPVKLTRHEDLVGSLRPSSCSFPSSHVAELAQGEPRFQ